mgnify:CR=1 FL=1|jgi:hypothetical protein
MTDFIFNGTISVTTDNKDAFIEDFNKFLETQNATFKGVLRAIEFDDAEIVDD